MQPDRASKRHVLILALVFSVYFVLFFYPFAGAGIDTVYYYAHLSSLAFDGDVDLTNDLYLANNTAADSKEMLSNIGPKGWPRSLYAIGTSILWAPFFAPVRLAALGLNAVLESPPAWTNDRYSPPYLFAVSLASLAYGFLAALLIYRTGRREYSPRAALLATLGVVFAGPIHAYMFIEPGMTHACSAFCGALLFHLSFRYRDFLNLRSYALLAAVLGLATLVRWQDLVMGLVPLGFWLDQRSRREARRPATAQALGILIGAAVFLAIVSVQLAYWHAQLGSFLSSQIYVTWTRPRFYRLFFSGWHGLFYCHPLMAAALAGFGLYVFRRRRRWSSWAMLLALALMIWTNAAVNDWFGGRAFGSRRFCAILPCFALGLAAVCERFRGRLFAVPAAITTVAMLLTIVLTSLLLRNIFDIFFLNEIWAVRGDFLAALPEYLATIPLDSIAVAGFALAGRWAEGMIVLCLGVGLIALAAIAVRKGWPRRIEARSAAALAIAVALFLALDVWLLASAPPVDRDGLLFARAGSPNERMAVLRHLTGKGYANPAVYMEAADVLGPAAPLDESLRTVRRLSPQFWSQWVLWLPPERTTPALRREAGATRRKMLTGPLGVYHERMAQAYLQNNARAMRHHYKALLRYDPFARDPLLWLADYYARQGDHGRAQEYRDRLIRILEARMDNFFAVEPKLAPWEHSVFAGYYGRFGFDLARLYEDRGELDGALALYQRMARFDPAGSGERNRQGQLVVRLLTATSSDSERAALRELDTPRTPVALLTHAAQLGIARGRRETALRTLMAGLKHYPSDAALVYWLRQVLLGDPKYKAPFEDLLAAAMESPEYWLCLGECLLAAGRNDDCVRVMRPLLESRPRDAWSHFICGLAHFNLGRFEEAEKLFRHASVASPASPAYALWLARTLARLGRYDEALPLIDRALATNPSPPERLDLERERESIARNQRPE